MTKDDEITPARLRELADVAFDTEFRVLQAALRAAADAIEVERETNGVTALLLQQARTALIAAAPTLIADLAAALERAQADAARMRSALEPFAVEYDRQAEYWPDKARVKAWAPFATAYRITIDDLRAARAALEPRP